VLRRFGDAIALTELINVIESRVAAAGLSVEAEVLRECAQYLTLLTRWNRRMNLTALPLADEPPDTSIDKLIVEPLVAAELFGAHVENWVDLGSGGGSPAIPLRLAHKGGRLRMVESRSRKCAFLREAVRSLELRQTEVVEARYETLPLLREADVVTVRALRIDDRVIQTLSGLLRPGGRVLAFGGRPSVMGNFDELAARVLPDGTILRVLSAR